ncbi:ribose-phosphate diphosphokinase [Minwuia thermotolerans]|uniref:Ribose-phosphate pyrophosphokinase n=1 Tax=Minwuia thermotolerans TaxID=2056226 RepID=A0A2M9G3P3_9PROT|nr:ribose-phosphate diphosphokinase [Minwuia thermotolerans]PJK30335.1 ribose-phosphate pyrophosphokinase [Minwuia thermotolerans]
MSPLFFALDTSHEYGERIARALEIAPADHEERAFEDGEHKARPLIDVWRQEALVFHTLHGEPGRSANDKLCRLLFFAAALKDAGADRVTAIVPYLCYARKDRRTKSRDPITSKYVARMFEAADVDAVLTVDVHNLAAFENAFRRPVINVEATTLFVRHFASRLRGERIAVVSPDVGGTKRAEQFRSALGAALGVEPTSGFVEKRRSSGEVSGDYFVGDVEGRTVILFDDMISTGTTLARAAARCRDAGAAKVLAAATHGAFSQPAVATLSDAGLEEMVVTDTIATPPAIREALGDRLAVLSTAPILAEAIIAQKAPDGDN